MGGPGYRSVTPSSDALVVVCTLLDDQINEHCRPQLQWAHLVSMGEGSEGTSAHVSYSRIVLSDAHANCSEYLRQLYNVTLTEDPKKKIDLSQPLSETHPVATLEELIKFTQEAKSKCDENRWPMSSTVDSMLKCFGTYALVIDVMIQEQPHVTALVWGGIRALLSVRTNARNRLLSALSPAKKALDCTARD